MRLILFISLLISCHYFNAQTSKLIDSTVVTELSQLTKKQEVFKSIYTNAFTESFYKRIDSIEFHNVIIEAKEIDSEFYFQEFYYTNEKDSFPTIVYFGGILEHNQGFYDLYDKKFLNTEITAIKKRQPLNYNTKFIRYNNGCATFKSTIKQRKKALKNTYQIQMYINKKNEKIRCSFQTPAKNPKLIIEERAVWF